MKKKTKIILAVIGVSMVTLTLIGIAVAFFTTNVAGGSESISANTVVLGSLSGSGNPITLANASPGDAASTDTYTVTYSSGATVAKEYSLSLVINDNDFVNTVKDASNSSTTQNGQLIIEVTIPNNVKTFTFDTTNSSFISYNSTTKKITIDATNGTVAKNGTYKLLTGVYIGPGATQNYSVSVQFKNLESYNQNDNQGKSFNGHLTIGDADDTDIEISSLDVLTYLNNSNHANGSISIYDKSTNATEYTNATAGIYKDVDTYGDTYFFRGNVTNNYVRFANRYWRIIRINGDGSLRIIYDGTQRWDNGTSSTDRYISKGAYNTNNNSNAYVGYMYGNSSGTTYNEIHANTNSSTIKTTLDTWYKAYLSDYSKYISDEIFCNDRSLESGTGFGSTTTVYANYNRVKTKGSPSFLCNRSPYTGTENNTSAKNSNHDAFTVNDIENGNGDLTYPIGLITADEFVAAGYSTGYYLNHGSVFWSASPHYFGKDVASNLYVGSGISDNDVVNNLAIVPVINLTPATAMSLKGNGTKNNPFQLSTTNDKSLKTLNYLNNSTHANGSISIYDKNINTTEYTNEIAGVYKDADTYGDTYFFRGNVTNNYIKFAGFYWRIIRINGDGTLRIIYDGTQGWDNGTSSTDRYISKGAYNTNNNSNAYVGYMYGNSSGTTYNEIHANTNNSTIKTILDTWYENNLKLNYASYIADEVFCNDRSLESGTGFGSTTTIYANYNRSYENGNPSFLCDRSLYTGTENKSRVKNINHDAFTVNDIENGNGDLTYPIGLITLDEFVAAGYSTGYYLNHGSAFWSAAPHYFGKDGASNLYVGSGISDEDVNNNLAIVPVINLTVEASLTLTGQGTKTNPFELS